MAIFPTFRRSKTPAELEPAEDDIAIDLGSIGGAINGTYVDIASLPPPEKPEKKARSKAPDRPPRERPPARQPERQLERPPEGHGPERQFERQPERQPDRQPAPTPAPQREQRPPRPRRRSDGNGAAMDRKGVLSVHGVEKSFVGRMVVKGVSLYVRKGEAVGLLGPNGAGKTTVFYMTTGLVKADKGRIELDGHDITRLPMYQRARLGIGYLPQEASIFRGLSVEDNIRAVLEVVERSAKRRDHDPQLAARGVQHRPACANRHRSRSPGGRTPPRRDRARFGDTATSYMLLDEPFYAGIDLIAVGDIQTLVRHLTNRGIGVLITDHNVRETLALTDRALRASSIRARC